MQELQKQIDELKIEIASLKQASTIPFDVEQAFRTRLANLNATYPLDLLNAPLSAITAPTGGLTVDSQARTAINTIITDLQTLGLTL